MPSSSGSSSDNQAGGLSYANNIPNGNGLNQKYGGFDQGQQFNQLGGGGGAGYNPAYGYQRPMYFAPYNQQPYQIPMNFYASGNGLYYGNDLFRPQSGAIPALGPYGSNSVVPMPNQPYPVQQQQHYQFGAHPSHLSQYHQAQGGSPPLSPFSRSMAQRKSDELEKKSTQ